MVRILCNYEIKATRLVKPLTNVGFKFLWTTVLWQLTIAIDHLSPVQVEKPTFLSKIFVFHLYFLLCYFSVVQSVSHAQFFVSPWTAAHQASLSFTISWSLLKLMSCEMVMPSNHLILCHHLLLLPSVFPSIKVFSNGLAGVGCHSLLPGIFPTQGWNLDLLHAGRFLTFWDTGEVYIIFLISDTVFCWCRSLIIAITLMHS